MNGGDLALAAVAGFAVTEATGVTDVTGGGSGRGSGGPSLGDIANVVEANQADTPDMGSLAQAVAQATESVPTVVQTGGGDSPAAGIQAALERLREQRQQVEDTASTVSETTDLVREIRKWREENVPTPDRDRDQNQDGSNGSSGGGGGGGNGSRTQGSDGYDLQTDYDGMFSEEVSGGAEILNQSGGVIDAVTSAPGDAAGFAGASGRTIGEAWDLVTKGRADTSGTLAKNRGEVMLDFSGDGNPGGKLTDRIPFVGGDDQDSSSDESSSTSSSSGASSSSDRDQREASNPVEQYKEDVRTVNDDPDDAPGREREKEKPDFSSNPVRNSWNTPGFTR